MSIPMNVIEFKSLRVQRPIVLLHRTLNTLMKWFVRKNFKTARGSADPMNEEGNSLDSCVFIHEFLRPIRI